MASRRRSELRLDCVAALPWIATRQRCERMSIVDHVNVPVADLDRARRFYEAVLSTLDVHPFGQDGPAFGFGRGDWNFGVVETPTPFPTLHVAFVAHSREQVDAFFAVALREGGRSNGEPGLREIYDSDYYAAFVFDPDGHNVEAVFRGARGPESPVLHGLP